MSCVSSDNKQDCGQEEWLEEWSENWPLWMINDFPSGDSEQNHTGFWRLQTSEKLDWNIHKHKFLDKLFNFIIFFFPLEMLQSPFLFQNSFLIMGKRRNCRRTAYWVKFLFAALKMIVQIVCLPFLISQKQRKICVTAVADYWHLSRVLSRQHGSASAELNVCWSVWPSDHTCFWFLGYSIAVDFHDQPFIASGLCFFVSLSEISEGWKIVCFLFFSVICAVAMWKKCLSSLTQSS